LEIGHEAHHLEMGLSPQLLEVEVTEGVLLKEHDPNTVGVLERIRALGVAIAFDDFGTGYASLSYLKRFPLDRLKIDRSFVGSLEQDVHDAAIVNAVVGLAKQLRLAVVAEGIDNERCAQLLQGLGCPEGQGYVFGKPMALSAWRSCSR
jgi:EAL domain-containing protein (putative c-di-GMP-specific phosphodiesterase class I)